MNCRFHDISDPEYSSAQDIPFVKIISYVLLGLVLLYVFYLGYIAIRACKTLRKAGKNLELRIKFFLLFLAVIIAVVIAGIFFTLLGPIHLQGIYYLS
jgi:hypothetical protein